MVTCKIKFIQSLLQLVLKRNTCQVTKYAEFGDETLLYTECGMISENLREIMFVEQYQYRHTY